MADHRLTRINDLLSGKYSWPTFIINIFIPFFFIAFLFVFQSNSSEIASLSYYLILTSKLIFIISILLWTFFYLLSVNIIEQESFLRLINSVKDKKRNTNYEYRIFKVSYGFVFTFLLVSYVFIHKYEANRYEVAIAVDDYSSYELKNYRLVLIDTRYNCYSCNNSLVKKDEIVFSRPDSTYRVMAKVKDFDFSHGDSGRFPASTKTIVKGGRPGQKELGVENRRIIGKVVKVIYKF